MQRNVDQIIAAVLRQISGCEDGCAATHSRLSLWRCGLSAPARTLLALSMKHISFGSSQDRKLFPYNCAPDRLGNELAPIRGDPQCGPGSYRNEEVSNMVYLLSKKPESKKGYTLGARTAVQFPLEKTIQTPGPAAYQSFWTQERVFTPAYAPFSIQAERFPAKVSDVQLHPGPGAYELEGPTNRRVTWPMKFGSPDWSLVPSLEKRTLRSELITDKEFRKHRNRVSYLSLYYS